MNGEERNVRIKLTDVGHRPQSVRLVLSKIHGLTDTPEQLLADVPCYISHAVSQSIAEKVQSYLEKAGATAEIEEAGSVQQEPPAEENMPSLFESPGYDVTSIEHSDDTFHPEHEYEQTSYEEVQADEPSDLVAQVLDVSHVQHAQPGLSALSQQDSALDEPYAETYDEPEPPSPKPRKKPRGKRFRTWRDFSGLITAVVLIVLLGGGAWLYFSGRYAAMTKTIKRNPVVGTVGILEVENDPGADLSLHHVVGTKVINKIPLEGRETRLERGDYYVEARKDAQVLRFPVYIEGRGHRVRVNVVFPNAEAPLKNLQYIPTGWFRMGNKVTNVEHFGFPDEEPDIDVYVNGFFLSQYEVTNRDYLAFIEDGGYENEVYWQRLIDEWPSLVAQVPEYGEIYGNNGWESVRTYIRKQFVNTDELPGPRLWENSNPPYEYGEDNHPVFGVTLYEAEAYCKWRTQQTGKIHRLPTEAEWEKAARGYEGYFFAYGNEYDGSRANTEIGESTTIGSFPANGYGLYDMTGNVWEWVSDHYSDTTYRNLLDTYQSEIRNPHNYDGTYNRGIVRGGSFRSVNRINARNPVRYAMYPNYWHTNIGFRYVVMP